MLGSLILYLKGMRIMMFQLSGYYYRPQAVMSRVSGARPKKALRSTWSFMWTLRDYFVRARTL